VAAPVIDFSGAARAAVGLVYPTDRHEPSKLIDPVRITANRICRSLHERTRLDPRTIDFNRRRAGLL
jgi:DNA-binding IclR family transcriptional regulator